MRRIFGALRTRIAAIALGVLILLFSALYSVSARRNTTEPPVVNRPHPVAEQQREPVQTVQTVDADASLADAGISDGAARDTAFAFPRAQVEATPIFTETENYLVLGLDARDGHHSVRADTIMIVVFDDESEHVGVLSIPRDIYVDLGNDEYGRINTIPGVAKRRNEAWMPLFATIIEQTIGIPIAHTIAVNLQITERAIDALGGIEVNVPCPIEDNFIDSRTESGRRLLSIPRGRVHMDGVTAAMYARSRHGRSDWDRARRQQAIVSALRMRVSEPSGMLAALRFLPEAFTLLETDLAAVDALSLAEKAMHIDPTRLHGMVLSTRATESYTTEDGQHVLLPIADAIHASVSELFAAPHPGTPRNDRCLESDAALRRGRSSGMLSDAAVVH